MKILLFDLETSPIVSYNWGIYEQNAAKVIQDWYLLCFAYKWLDGKVQVERLSRGRKSEKELIRKLWKLFDEADIIIAHNARRFDIKKSNAKFIEYGFPPPSPYKVIDTLTEAKRYFAFTSNKLDDLGEILKLGRKVKHPGIEMWHGCMIGDEKSWDLMTKYNKQDVILLEAVYLRLRDWTIQPTASWGKLNCPYCSSGNTRARGKRDYIDGRERKRHSCNDCNKIFLGNYIIKRV